MTNKKKIEKTQPYLVVPCYDNGVWTVQEFYAFWEWKAFVKSCFKLPGDYNFDNTSFLFNQSARYFTKNGFYTDAPYKSLDFITYWDFEKEKCRRGVIFKNKGKVFYLTRDYYMFINYLKMYDKVKKGFYFPDVWDSHYHTFLYEYLAELSGKHVAILKKRQWGSSYLHCAKLINQIWFEEGVICKMGASLKKYINEEGSWKYLNEYKDFLNTHTAWYREMNPDKTFMWQQKVETINAGRKVFKGLKGTIQGTSFEKDATAGVGGPCDYFYHEEAGIAPKMDVTAEFMLPALKSGNITTGLWIAAGSVGDLSQCEPLKNMILKPKEFDIYEVETNLIDDTGIIGVSGLFIPEQWSMPPFIDEYGNSDVEGALESILEERKIWKRELTPEMYQYRISQKPINIKEAFDFRDVSKFPLNLVSLQEKAITEEKLYPYELLDLSYDANGKVVCKPTTKAPISEFPLSKKIEDKSGSIQVWERPDENKDFGKYYASVDPVGTGKTTTSDSLCSIYIYKSPTEVTKIEGREVKNFIEGDRIVAAWCGRFDDINATHERLELLIVWYNAFTIVENNVPLFITHMINKKKQHYLVSKQQIVFLKEVGSNKSVFQEYGWRNTGNLFKAYLLNYLIEWLKEEINQEVDEKGEVIQVTYGISRLPDLMALKEMIAYRDGVNVDRLIALAALISYVTVQKANLGFHKELRKDDKTLDKSKNLSKLSRSPFRNIGKGGYTKSHRNPFRRLK